MHDDTEDRRETTASREKLVAIIISAAAVVLGAGGSSLAFLSDVAAKFAIMDARIVALQSDLERIEKEKENILVDIRTGTAIHHALSERIARCEIFCNGLKVK